MLNCRLTRHMNYSNFSVDSQAVRRKNAARWNMATFKVVIGHPLLFFLSLASSDRPKFLALKKKVNT